MNTPHTAPTTPALAGRRVVVTGASGFVGRVVLDHLVRAGAQAVALSRQGTQRTGVEDHRLAHYRDQPRLQGLFKDAVAVVHLAARAHQLQEDAAASAAAYEEANVQTALQVAQACQAAGVPRLVLMSSIGVNGNRTTGRPYTEQDVPAPLEDYARSKWRAEQAVAERLASGATDYVTLRPPLVYGPGAPGNFARLSRLVARAPLVPLGGFTRRRTFVAVDNLADATLIACTHPALSRRTLLVADAESVTVAELARALAIGHGRSPGRVVNVPLPLISALARLAGKAELVDKLACELQVDAREFTRLTGWAPQVSPRLGLQAIAQTPT